LDQKPEDGEITTDGFHRILSSMETDIQVPRIMHSAGWRMNKKMWFSFFISFQHDCGVIEVIVQNQFKHRYAFIFK